jgi:hypothetical protein
LLAPQKGAGLFSTQDVIAMIAALVLNAAPNPSQSMRRRRGARGLLLWGTLLSVIPEYEGATLERTSIRWPVALWRRFLSGLYYRTRRRWPYTPYRAATQLHKPVERAEIVAAFGLAGGTQNSFQTPAISPSGCQKSPEFRMGFKCSTGSVVRDLSAVNRPLVPKSGI